MSTFGPKRSITCSYFHAWSSSINSATNGSSSRISINLELIQNPNFETYLSKHWMDVITWLVYNSTKKLINLEINYFEYSLLYKYLQRPGHFGKGSLRNRLYENRSLHRKVIWNDSFRKWIIFQSDRFWLSLRRLLFLMKFTWK